MRPMELLRPTTMLLVIAFASAQQVQKPTDGVAWGSTVSGFRIGAAFGSDPSKPTIRVVFQNVGSVVQDVLLGFDGGGGLMYHMKFIATAPDGKEREGSHTISSAVGGFVGPLSVRLNAGESHELQFPLKDISYVSPTIVTLDALVQQGYSVRVRFEVKQGSADWAKLSHCRPTSFSGYIGQVCQCDLRICIWDPWIGTVSSAEVSLAH